MRAQLLELFYLGLKDFRSNLNALMKYGDTNAAAEHLFVHGVSGLQ